MLTKEYERTGIKEDKNLRENKEQMLKRKKREENLQITTDRTRYHQDVLKKYDTSLMSREKECKKIEKLLENYYDRSSSEKVGNVFQLVSGYQEYFSEYGENMTTMELRAFRKGIAKTLSVSNEQALLATQFSENIETPLLETNPQDDAILDFCVENFQSLTTKGLNSLELAGFLLNAGTPIQNIENLKEAKIKVKNLLESTKPQK